MDYHRLATASGVSLEKILRNTLLGGACLAVLAAPAAAQQDQAADDQSVETVVVTGLIGSLQRDLDIKRQSTGIVDAISAEDIGKFPDVNLADAMMRIPGVTVTRGATSGGMGARGMGTGSVTSDGEATEITVRGFGPQFNETLYDGRQVATGTGDRAFDFSSVTSDFVSQIDVLKSPDATLSAGAIGATINVKFPKPFDHPGLVIAGSLSGTVSPEDGKWGPNGDLLISDTFAGDTFGILVDASYSDTKVRANHINNQGWEGTTSGFNAVNGVNTQDVGTPAWFIQDYGIYQEQTDVERMQGRLALQWRPSDNLLVTVNDNFSRDHLNNLEHGYSIWFNPPNMQNVQLDSNGTVVDFTQATPTDFQGQINSSILQYNDYGANVAWNVTDNFSLTLDADHADSWLNPGGQVSSIDADVGYGNAADNTVLGITIPTGHSIPYPNGYGPNGDMSQFINNGLIGSHVLPITTIQNLDTVNQVKLEGDWESDQVTLKFGMQYVAEHNNQQGWDDFENNNWQAYAGYGPASGNVPDANGPKGVTLPQSFFSSSFSTKDFINGYSGSSNLPPAILAYSPYTILNYLNGLNGAGANFGCCTPNGSGDAGRPFSGQYQVAFNPGDYHVLSESTFSGFMESTIKTQIGGLPLRINVGARYDVTNEDLSGLGRVPVSFVQQSGDLTSWAVNYSPIQTISAEHQYSYLLPNLDFDLSLTDDLDIRFDASRTLTRPEIANLNPITNVVSARVGTVTASSGNPNLLPYLSDNLDLGAQYYYQANSYLSVDAFLKSVDNFIIQQSSPGDYGNIGHCIAAASACPGAGAVIDVPYSLSQPTNGPAANVYGLELAWQHVFGDSGFGYMVNGTLVGTNSPYNPNDLSVSNFAVTGLADSANFMAFYDKNGFQVRLAANWEDTYLDHFGQLQNGSAFGSEPTFVNANWNLDLSTSYDITSQVTAYAEAMNLTDATYSTHGRFSNQFLDIVDYGRKFIFGVHFKY